MSSTGQFNTKSPTIKRILREAAEISQATSSDYTAAPLETNLFEWHFTIKGPPSTPYAEGLYHGRIVLPPTYPLRPPSFRFSTPSGRFEPNREICLSISGHHEESWQPAWGIRTALVAIRAFMESDAKGQVGGVDTSNDIRERLAKSSRTWSCPTCKKTNEEIVMEREVEVGHEGAPRDGVPEQIPEALKLGYREELVGGKQSIEKTSPNVPHDGTAARLSETPATPRLPTNPTTAVNPAPPVITGQFPLTSPLRSSGPTRARQRQEDVTSWVDMAIGGLTLALAYMIIRKLAMWL